MQVPLFMRVSEVLGGVQAPCKCLATPASEPFFGCFDGETTKIVTYNHLVFPGMQAHVYPLLGQHPPLARWFLAEK
jgi:hypothetical protein